MLNRLDLYTKVTLTVIAVLLAALVLQPAINPAPVQAQSDSPSLYIEPGITYLPNPETRSEVPGKLVIDLKTGETWGFPTIFSSGMRPPISRPIYLGRYDFAGMKRTQ